MPQSKRKLIAIAAVLVALVIAAIVGYILTQSGDRPLVAKGRKEIATIAAGKAQTLILSGGRVYSAGWNDHAQVAVGGDLNASDRFVEVDALNKLGIIAVSTRGDHALALGANGKLYAAGRNGHGQLGLGGAGVYKRFALAPINDLTYIAAGSNHSFAIDKSGKVYATGWNELMGLLGLGDRKNRKEFAEVTSLGGKKIVAIATSVEHTLALSADGKVYAAGRNGRGSLGLGDRIMRESFAPVPAFSDAKIVAVEVASGGGRSFALAADGKVYATRGWNEGERARFAEIAFLRDKQIEWIAAGYGHVLALSRGGRVYAMGWNARGQLGVGDADNRDEFTLVSSLEGKKIVWVAAGDFHSFALDEFGALYATGENKYGQLGLGDKADRNVFTPVILSDRQLK
jgi:alpha-tubulin suppressor-like RCC1 family protein